MAHLPEGLPSTSRLRSLHAQLAPVTPTPFATTAMPCAAGDMIPTRPLFAGGPEVSCVGLGAWPLAGAHGAVDQSAGVSAVQAAVRDYGMTFIGAIFYRFSDCFPTVLRLILVGFDAQTPLRPTKTKQTVAQKTSSERLSHSNYCESLLRSLCFSTQNTAKCEPTRDWIIPF